MIHLTSLNAFCQVQYLKHHSLVLMKILKYSFVALFWPPCYFICLTSINKDSGVNKVLVKKKLCNKIQKVSTCIDIINDYLYLAISLSSLHKMNSLTLPGLGGGASRPMAPNILNVTFY